VTKWSPAEDALLRVLVEEKHLDSAEIAEHFRQEGIRRTQKAIQRYIARHKIRAKVPQSPVPPLQQLTVQGDFLLLFDIHSPLQDADWINRVMELALDMGIDSVGIGGDLVEFDAFSHFRRSEDYDIRDELKTTRKLLSALANFDRVIFSPGNHEVRLSRKLNWLLPVDESMKLFLESPKVQMTSLHWFEVISGGEKFRVEHPKNTSVHAALIPQKLCSKFLCHIIAGHGHDWGLARDVSDHFWAIDAGCCLDPKRVDYCNREHSTRPVMKRGAVIVKDGIPLLLSPHNIQYYEKTLDPKNPI